MRRRSIVVPLLIVTLFFAGCAKRVNTGAAVSPWEHVMIYNQMLAEANNTVAHTAVNANTARVLPDATTKAILTAQARAAKAHLELTTILNKGPQACQSDAAAIQALIDQIRESGDQMVLSGDLNIKDPQTQVTIATAVDTFTGLAQQLVAALKVAGIGGLK